MKVKELRNRTEADLMAELSRLRREVQEGRTKLRLNQMKNVKTIKLLKRDIARILTILGELKAQ